jgi:hypothetical protein
MYLSYVEIVLYSTLLVFFFLLPTLSPFLTFPFSTTSASPKRWTMVDLVDLVDSLPHAAALSLSPQGKCTVLLIVDC